MDYKSLIDEQMWAFINKTNGFFPDNASSLPIADQRALYNKMCIAFTRQPTRPIQRDDYLLSERVVPVRQYSIESNNDSQAIVVYYHGGGFVVGDLNSHDDVCADICAHTGFTVIACDYRLAPEFKHPEAFDDAYAVFEALTNKTSKPILLVGDSAGATLAAGVSSKARDNAKHVAAQVLIYPYLGGPTDSGSGVTHAQAPMLSTRDIKYYDLMRLDPSRPPLEDKTFAPLVDTDFSNLPPTVIFAAQYDPLCDDGVTYAKQIQQAGGQAHCTIEPGLVHGYLRARHTSAVAKESFKRMLLAIESLYRPER